ncbi:hypothetical protein DIC82_15025 [Clostridium beijerinckii]|nr:hypothetical protein DIC82_15025 [Clostridium beijerinckii]
MIAIKQVAKLMTLKELEKRFEMLGSYVQDKITGKNYHCPHDLGFNFTLDDCISSGCCKDCWIKAKDIMKLKDSKII